MCTGIEKLRRAGDQVLIKRNQERAELLQVKKDLSQALKEKEVAESDARFTHARNMFLTKKADIANLWMIFTSIGFVISVGFLVY